MINSIKFNYQQALHDDSNIKNTIEPKQQPSHLRKTSSLEPRPFDIAISVIFFVSHFIVPIHFINALCIMSLSVQNLTIRFITIAVNVHDSRFVRIALRKSGGSPLNFSVLNANQRNSFRGENKQDSKL